MKKKYNRIVWWQAVLLLAAFVTAICKIYIGMDHDESYIVVMGIRLLNGDRMFDTMWDLHMTSAWPAWIGTEVFYRITGSLDGLVVFSSAVSDGVYRVSHFEKILRTGECFSGSHIDSVFPAESNTESGIWIIGDAVCDSHVGTAL